MSFDEKYDSLEELGKGAFGIVKKCRNKMSGQFVAAKFVRKTQKSKMEFSREVDIMNKLCHDKIIQFIESFESEKYLIIVMELVDGKELFEKVLEDDFQLSEKKVAECIRQILIALNHMHEKNIVHLDLKPENILCYDSKIQLTIQNADNTSEEVKIIDFGSSRELRKGIQESVLCGTPEYVAPEVIAYDPISLKTDIWSVGVITYVLLSGNSPFLGDTDVETMSNVTEGKIDFEEDCESFESVTEDAKQFIIDCLKIDPRKRISVSEALNHKWLKMETNNESIRNIEKLKTYVAKRKWKGVIHAVRAVGRFAAKSTLPESHLAETQCIQTLCSRIVEQVL
ncbi:myosin light chain kinase, smooth muscle [Hydra vulgaris]|uniref:myosin light chain kinase, smooth muscle n=1 Tax=Hydra vulgaris TaxID=6087 RepID=UPI001F5F84CF|nr:myosin light chain kinase, smooth muscle [Hydra vulgaris]XP_012555997.2 myosin light chain kinase, smooth muscle [Hydra vulgaris]XP_012555998.2 myosin light chain kinase, smooth muscle [Hydra vulgaris]XP_047138556.1 myosin light chain kinase, smooth muscle [Hydra vulgaris]